MAVCSHATCHYTDDCDDVCVSNCLHSVLCQTVYTHVTNDWTSSTSWHRRMQYFRTAFENMPNTTENSQIDVWNFQQSVNIKEKNYLTDEENEAKMLLLTSGSWNTFMDKSNFVQKFTGFRGSKSSDGRRQILGKIPWLWNSELRLSW